MIDLLPDLSGNGVSLLKQWAKIITLTRVNENRTVASNLLQSVLMAEDLCPPNATYSDYNVVDDTARPITEEGIISSLIANARSYSFGNTSYVMRYQAP